MKKIREDYDAKLADLYATLNETMQAMHMELSNEIDAYASQIEELKAQPAAPASAPAAAPAPSTKTVSRCGVCKSERVTIAHVKACSSASYGKAAA